MRLIEIPDDGIVRIPIMRGKDTVGERRIDLSHFPTIDAEPIRHVRPQYIFTQPRSMISDCEVICEECGYTKRRVDGEIIRYCQYCGAKMDLKGER